MQIHKNYYELLGVSINADSNTIKKAFRKKAKEKHPDSGSGSNESMRQLLEAYRILTNPEKRYEYDKLIRKKTQKEIEKQFDYHEWILERISKPEYIVKLIFYDLLHNLEDEALDLYESINNNQEARFERFFERSEAMDAEFCIAEELIKREKFKEAYHILVKLVVMETQKPAFGYFFDVILSQLQQLIDKRIKVLLDPDQLLHDLTRLSEIVKDKNFRIWALKIMQSIYKKNKMYPELEATTIQLASLKAKRQKLAAEPPDP